MSLDKRLEMMRQITKPAKGLVTVFVLIDYETREAIGAYSSEALAEEMAEEIYKVYQADTFIRVMDLDQDLETLMEKLG